MSYPPKRRRVPVTRKLNGGSSTERALPRDKAALALALRESERRGEITPLGDLHARVVATGYSDEEIDESFSALVDKDGRVLGVSVQLGDSNTADRQLELTKKGETMLKLLLAYADEHQVWRSNIYQE